MPVRVEAESSATQARRPFPSKLRPSDDNLASLTTTTTTTTEPIQDANLRQFVKVSLSDTELAAVEHAHRDRATQQTAAWRQVKQTAFIVGLSTVIVASAIIVTVFQSLLLSARHYYFPFPIFSAAVTNFVQLGLSVLLVGVYGGLSELCRLMFTGDGWRAAYQAILPCSLVTAAELAVSLASLQYVTVSFFTMVKSSSVIFVLCGAFIMRREPVSLVLVLMILLTGTGVVLAAWDPSSTTGLDGLGFSLVLLASILNAFKWVLTEMLLNENVAFQRILQRLCASNKRSRPHNLSPLLTVLLLSPLTLLALVAASAILEDIPRSLLLFTSQASLAYIGGAGGGLLLISVLVFVMRVADFRLVQLVTLVTFSLLGIVREVIMILFSVLLLGEVLFPVNYAGLILTIVGVGLYNYYRSEQKRQSEALVRANLEIELGDIDCDLHRWRVRQSSFAK